MTPSDYDRATAQLISDYLTLGMNHNTEDGLEAIARIVAERSDVPFEYDEAMREESCSPESIKPSALYKSPWPAVDLSYLPENARF